MLPHSISFTCHSQFRAATSVMIITTLMQTIYSRVTHVLLMRSQVKVNRIHAGRVVAAVAHKQSIWNRSNAHHVGNSMRSNNVSEKPEFSVSMHVVGSRPDPATITHTRHGWPFLVHLFPESRFRCVTKRCVTKAARAFARFNFPALRFFADFDCPPFLLNCVWFMVHLTDFRTTSGCCQQRCTHSPHCAGVASTMRWPSLPHFGHMKWPSFSTSSSENNMHRISSSQVMTREPVESQTWPRAVLRYGGFASWVIVSLMGRARCRASHALARQKSFGFNLTRARR